MIVKEDFTNFGTVQMSYSQTRIDPHAEIEVSAPHLDPDSDLHR